MRSLKTLEDGNAGKDVIDKYKIKEGRKWDERYNMLCNLRMLYVLMTCQPLYKRYTLVCANFCVECLHYSVHIFGVLKLCFLKLFQI